MKRIVCLLLTLMMVASLAGCGEAAKQPAANSGAQAQTATADAMDAAPAEAPATETVDLTRLSGTMIYAEVYNMLSTPEDYIGKTVKMKGPFAVYQDAATGKLYFAVVIADATACCSQGIEFVLDGNYAFPEDYPELGTEITVMGEFQTYMENGLQFCHLVGAKLI